MRLVVMSIGLVGCSEGAFVCGAENLGELDPEEASVVGASANDLLARAPAGTATGDFVPMQDDVAPEMGFTSAITFDVVATDAPYEADGSNCGNPGVTLMVPIHATWQADPGFTAEGDGFLSLREGEAIEDAKIDVFTDLGVGVDAVDPDVLADAEASACGSGFEVDEVTLRAGIGGSVSAVEVHTDVMVKGPEINCAGVFLQWTPTP